MDNSTEQLNRTQSQNLRAVSTRNSSRYRGIDSNDFINYDYNNLYRTSYNDMSTKQPKLLTYLGYMFSFVTFYMFYTLVNLTVLTTDQYWKGYFITLLLQAVECVPLVIIDKKIKR